MRFAEQDCAATLVTRSLKRPMSTQTICMFSVRSYRPKLETANLDKLQPGTVVLVKPYRKYHKIRIISTHRK